MQEPLLLLSWEQVGAVEHLRTVQKEDKQQQWGEQTHSDNKGLGSQRSSTLLERTLS
jgi:hypothetical protein